ncbi:unnamed protein product [Clavelina lepadiformis]|uniref:Zinc finger PHD-type domain-containing protein n=1 Tax=Clavelina lepadiformis TaxID=159417 RepID=A0ABP0FDB6_CLALP
MPESLPAQPIDVAQPSSPEDANSSFTIISPVEVLPMPKAAHTRQKRKSKRGATAILTSSPYKKQLAATNRSQSAVSGNSSKTSSSKKRSMKKAKVSRSSMQQKDTVDESDNNVDAECFYCNEMYSKSSENDGWIQCSKCMRWAHEACSGCNEEDDNFIYQQTIGHSTTKRVPVAEIVCERFSIEQYLRIVRCGFYSRAAFNQGNTVSCTLLSPTLQVSCENPEIMSNYSGLLHMCIRHIVSRDYLIGNRAGTHEDAHDDTVTTEPQPRDFMLRQKPTCETHMHRK